MSAAATYEESVQGAGPRVPGESALAAIFAVLSGRFAEEEPPLDEAALARVIERARAGDAQARRTLYVQFVDRVFRTVRGMLRSDADAEDVTQDAMLTVLTSLRTYRPRPEARFGAWVATIAVNTARRRFRRRRPELTTTGILPDIPAGAIDPDDALDRLGRRRALLAALADLPARDRMLISLRYGSDLNATEIAASTGLAPAAVRKALERIRARLAARLEHLFSDGDAS